MRRFVRLWSTVAPFSLAADGLQDFLPAADSFMEDARREHRSRRPRDGTPRGDGALVHADSLGWIIRLRTAKKKPVDHPHIRMPVSASTPPSSRHSRGSTRSP
jgi:hypothetical protein